MPLAFDVSVGLPLPMMPSTTPPDLRPSCVDGRSISRAGLTVGLEETMTRRVLYGAVNSSEERSCAVNLSGPNANDVT